LEEVGLRVLSDYGLSGQRVRGFTGVWVGQEKVMAIGVGVRKWVTCHGLALNVNNDLEYFRLIHPCGIQDRGVTSLARLLKREIALEEVKERLIFHFARTFEAKMQRMAEGELRETIHRGRCEGSEAILAGTKGTQA
jgi:lipoate-protein ligase B